MSRASQAKLRLAMDLVRLVLGDDRATVGDLGIQLLQYSTGMRQRLSAGRSPRRRWRATTKGEATS